MSTLQILMLSIFIAILILENYGYGYWMISRPIFAGPLIGLILGDLRTGLLVGGSVELMYMGVIPVGGSVPPNAQIAGILSTVFAIMSKGNVEIGIALAYPIGILAQLLIMLAWNINIFLIHKADNYILAGDVKKVEQTHLMGLLVFFIVFFIPTFLAIQFGSDFVNSLIAAMPVVLTDGLKIASGIMPAVGMAMLLRMMNFKKYWSFFAIGFVCATYLKLDVLAISIIAVAVVAAIFSLRSGKAGEDEIEDIEEAESDNIVKEKTNTILTDGILKKVFLRSFFSMTSINYERYCSLGFCYAMIPALKVLYPNKEEFNEALQRHNEFYNCHPYTGNAVLGVTLALEEQRAMGRPISGEAISSTKAALMGPLSSIGDSVFKATFMTIFAAIAAALALDGNTIAPIVFIVPNVLLNVFSRWYFIKYGHKLGTDMIAKMQSTNIIEKFVEGATIVGMMVVGAMTVSFVKLSLASTWMIGEKEIVLQALLDSIMPNLLPLLVVLSYYWILSRDKKGMYTCIILTFAIGILGKAVSLF